MTGAVSICERPSASAVVPTAPRVRVVVADDDEMIRQTLGSIIQGDAGLELVGLAKDADDAIRIVSLRRPDVALLDVRMPSGGGPRAAQEIRWRSPGTRMIALSAHEDARSVDDMLASGANSYLVKDTSVDSILEAIHRTAEGQATLSQAVANHVAVELGTRLEREQRWIEEQRDKELRIRSIIDGGDDLTMVYQPITEVGTGKIVGFEALARFSSKPERPPDIWFEEAAEVGLGTELQMAAAQRALMALDRIPDDLFVSINLDPDALLSPTFEQVLQGWPADRIMAELTEHVPAYDYPGLMDMLAHLRRSDVRLAVDDAGSGFASLRHILKLDPDVIKLDLSITRDIDIERSNRALASCLVAFGSETGAGLIAEGVETREELETLRDVGIAWAQGYYLRPPGPLPDRFDRPLPWA